jgi:hypothetical protein
MLYEPPPYFALKRYRPSISETYHELTPFKNIAALISTKKLYDNVWSLDIVEYPEVILEGSQIVESNDDIWFNSSIPTFSVYSDNKMNRVVMKFNNYIIRHSSGCIPLFKMSEPCFTLHEAFLRLNTDTYKKFRFELVVSKLMPVENIITSNSHIQNLIDKNETCPVSMIPLTRYNTRITSCGHAFSSSVERWISEKGSCPVCRSAQNIDTLLRWT